MHHKSYTYIKQDVPNLTERALQGFTQDELLQQHLKITGQCDYLLPCEEPTDEEEGASLLLTWIIQELHHHQIIPNKIPSIHTGTVCTFNPRKLSNNIIHDSFQKNPSDPHYFDPEQVYLTLQAGLNKLKRDKVILDFYLCSSSNKNPDHWVIFLN